MGFPAALLRRRRGASPLAIYAVLGRLPKLAFDFDGEKYFTGGSRSTFDDSITHSATTNATMVDSDGVLKWRPHNILQETETWSVWNAVRTTKSVSGNVLTLTQATGETNGGGVLTSATVLDGWEVSYEVKAKPNGKNFIRMATNFGAFRNTYFDVNAGTVGSVGVGHTASISGPDADGFYLCKLVVSVSSPTNDDFGIYLADTDGSGTVTDSGGVFLKEPRAYRSDLGGMVDNPDTGNSYVPTTGAARYLPRRGHHVWNGSAWVNEGLLHESEARTNLLTYSETIDGTGWSDGGSTSTNLTDGALGAWGGVSIASGGAFFHRLNADDLIAVTSGDTLTFRVWVKEGTSGNLRINFINPVSLNQSNLTGSFGSLAANQGSLGTITSVKEEDWGNGTVAVSGTITVNFTGDLGIGVGPHSAVSGETVIVYAAQIEEATTPSSYIPNYGAPSGAHRAAETLTIPAAKLPWPTPNVIGSELVTNGTFDTDSDWTKGTGWTISGGKATVVATASVPTNLKQNIAFEDGKVYKVEFTISGATNLQGSDALVAFGLGDSANDTVFSADGFNQLIIVASSNSDEIDFRITGVGEVGDSYSVDNISVREIDPLSVSIQMDGRMTYADTDEVAAVNQVRWQADASNRIYQFVTTSGGATGKFGVQQISGGVVDSSQETGNTLVPGILTPFNTAGRHGSTFIRGAIDGTLLPANTTPTALPDLSTTDLELGYDYMGTIRTFRMWDQDLGDSGIEEASA